MFFQLAQISEIHSLFHCCSFSETVADGDRLFYSISSLLSTRGGKNQLNNFLQIGRVVMHDAVSAIDNALMQPSSILSSHLVYLSDNLYRILCCLSASAL